MSLSLPRGRYPEAPAQYHFYQRLQERLPPVEFEPWWVQTTIGFAVRF